jgi:hypothetical protein
MARSHTKMGVRVLASIAKDTLMPPAARVSAIALLFQRGWGPVRDDGGSIGERIIVEIVQGGGSINVVHQIDAQPEPFDMIEQEHERNGK